VKKLGIQNFSFRGRAQSPKLGLIGHSSDGEIRSKALLVELKSSLYI
jgi:hypothetical protein